MRSICTLSLLFALGTGLAQEPLWLRYPNISPDGNTLLFNYKGDIYSVPSSGGQARSLSTHPAHDFMPTWSVDGKEIAFASDRHGNYDIFLMPANGGAATRLTHHSADDEPHSIDRDGNILFSASRLDDHKNSQFPSGRLPELYSINKEGKLKQVLTTPAEMAVWNKNKSKLLYQDKKGYEDPWRKHHTSSIARDIWMYDPATGEHSQLTQFEGEDRNPVWSNDEKSMFYLSEASGSFNVWKMDLSTRKNSQITFFDKHPVRFLSMAQNGLMSFSYHGELYTLKEGEQAKKLSIKINQDENFNALEWIDVKSEASEMTLSPNGKEIAFVARGEIFVTSTDFSDSKRLTNTPEQERSISFSPDGRSILFAAERGGSWNLYKINLSRKEEPYFYAATLLEEEAVLVSDKETFQPQFSPDGKEIAYLEDRVILKVLNPATKISRTVLEKKYNYSYSDGDQSYQWSPDGKWFLVSYLPFNRWNSDIGLVSADGVKKINLTESGYDCHSPKWAMEGEAVIWFSGKYGMKNQGSWGFQDDAYIMFLTESAEQKFKLSESEYAIIKEAKSEEKDEKDKDKKKKDESPKILNFDLDRAKDRVQRLTIHSSNLSDAILTKDGSKMYYLSAFEKGYDLWMQDFKKNETKLLSKLEASNGELAFDKEEKHLIFISNESIKKIDVGSNKVEAVPYNAKMEWKPQEELGYIFEHAWRQTLRKFYVEDMHGVDWAFYKKEYEKFLPHINNGADFAEMLSELLGELNASHTGARYRPSKKGSDHTASLGIYFDYNHEGPGVKVSEIIDKGPLVQNGSQARAGMLITAINGESIKNLPHYFSLLKNQAGNKLLIDFESFGKKHSEVVKPISQGEFYALRYDRYVKERNAQVEELSDGKLGYVHVQGMNDESFRRVYADALGKHADKEGLIVDTRFNGGGWLHDDLATFLDGEIYATFLPRGQKIGHEPLAKWYKKSAVLIGEGNYSDAHGFPFAYRALGIGKTVGMPVPGTMTAVWWERQINPEIVFGIPQVGVQDMQGRLMENFQFEPDIKVKNDYQSVAEGRDKQLEAAVKMLLTQ